MKKHKIFLVWMVAVLAMTMLAGCSSKVSDGSDTSSGDEANVGDTTASRAGSLLVCVNPEIEVVYDDKGLVISLEGKNEDGKAVLEDFTDFIGKNCTVVVNRLVDKIHEKGYFNDTVDGREKNIVIKVGEDSVYPSDDFVDDIAQGMQETVNGYGGTAKVIAVEEDDLDDRGYINETTAKELAMAQAGVPNAEFVTGEYDLDDGIYELKFVKDGVTYELEVDARTGKVLEADLENNDDWNDDDDDDDQDDDNDDSDDNDDRNDDNDDRDDDSDDNDDWDDNNDDNNDWDDNNDDNDDWDDNNDDNDDNDDVISAPVAPDDDDNDDDDNDNDDVISAPVAPDVDDDDDNDDQDNSSDDSDDDDD